MKSSLFSLLALASFTTTLEAAKLTSQIVKSGGYPFRPKLFQALLEKERQQDEAPNGVEKLSILAASATPVAHNFSQLISHFPDSPKYQPNVNGTFPQRFWVNTTFYKPGGPVIVIDGGETSGANRLPFIITGVARKLAEATGGVAAILEHRYYGTSFPVANLTTDEMRFLDTAQSLADLDYFARNVVIPGLEDKDLTAPGTKWIGYGGSYAGAKAAFLRTTYPETYYGTIASSGVVHAQWDYWQYNEAIRVYGPPACIGLYVYHVDTVDRLLLLKNSALSKELKSLSGLQSLTNDVDFASTWGFTLGNWQAKNWDPALNSDGGFSEMCEFITDAATGKANATAVTDTVHIRGRQALVPNSSSSTAAVSPQLEAALKNIIRNPLQPVRQQNNLTNSGPVSDQVVQSVYNSFLALNSYAKGFFGDTETEFLTLDAQAGGIDYNLSNYDSLSWTYQYCTQYGYIQPGAPADHPTLFTRLSTAAAGEADCQSIFPAGKYPNAALPTPEANVEEVNSYGDFDIAYDRLAFVDGEQDPWRQACVHSFYAPHPVREDTLKRPYKLIPGAVHHWDENGLDNTDDEPPAIKQIHEEQIAFVTAWLENKD